MIGESLVDTMDEHESLNEKKAEHHGGHDGEEFEFSEVISSFVDFDF